MTFARRIVICFTMTAWLLAAALCGSVSAQPNKLTVWVLMKDGKQVEGEMEPHAISFDIKGKKRTVGLCDLLTLQTGSAASEYETARIASDLASVGTNADRQAREYAVTELTDIGLPVLSPLLSAYKDSDAHEPKPLYRLFARLIPGYADAPDRTLDLVRLANGEIIRGHASGRSIVLMGPDRAEITVPFMNVRRLAVRRKSIEKTFDIDALRHCTPIEFLDTGVGVSAASRIEETARGLVRLSFDIDGWASDPDGLKVPGPHYTTNLVDGFPFGALIGRVGPSGNRWLAGRHILKSNLQTGRLYFAVNDNGHWQNNIGSFRVRLSASDAYDLGDAQ